MLKGSIIRHIYARQVYSGRGVPAVEATVVTENGSVGTAQCTAGASIGTHEVAFSYDGGIRWHGKGVARAVDNVERLIAPALIGMDTADQRKIDDTMLHLGGAGAKERLGGNAVGAVSVAVLKAGASALRIPLYQHIGGDQAVTLPCASDGAVIGSNRYLSVEGGKPTYSFIAYDFPRFEEAGYAIWEISTRWTELMNKRYGIGTKTPSPGFPSGRFAIIPPGIVDCDEQLWKMMCDVIADAGFEGRVGLQCDIAGDCYYNRKTKLYRGIFDGTARDRDAFIAFIVDMTSRYPFVIIEDPLFEDDFEGHAIVTQKTGIQVVGDDLFATNTERVQRGIAAGSCNAVLLKVNQVGSISEAFEMVRLADENGYGVMPCCSRGEDISLCDYCVGINAATVRENCFGSALNRFLEIEKELGSRAVFAGKKGIKGAHFAGRTVD